VYEGNVLVLIQTTHVSSFCLIEVKLFCKKFKMQQGIFGFELLELRQMGGMWRSGRKCLLSLSHDLAVWWVEDTHP